ncbi:hypothetical protein SHIRM173S_03133 [Streptomyces hirsutus]
MAMVKGIDVRGMQHCETTALGVLLRHEGLDLSEPMLFGLGSGLSFIYWDSKAMGFPFLEAGSNRSSSPGTWPPPSGSSC